MDPSITSLLVQLETPLQQGRELIVAQALNLLKVLVTIEVILFGLYAAIAGGVDNLTALKRLLSVGLFLWFIDNYTWIINEVMEGFFRAGAIAGNAPNLPFETFKDPMSIIYAGFKSLGGAMTRLQSSGLLSINLDLIFILFAALFSIVCIMLVAVQVLVTYIEFLVVSGVAAIMIPFGIFKPLAFIAEKAFGAIIAFGVKLMTMSLVFATCHSMIEKFSLRADCNYEEAFYFAAASLAIAVLAWQIPKLAMSIMAGSPQLNGNDAIRGAVSAGTAGIGMAAGLAGVGTRAAAGAIGGALEGGKNAYASSGSEGSSGGFSVGRAAAALGGGAIGALRGGIAGALTYSDRRSESQAVTRTSETSTTRIGSGPQSVGQGTHGASLGGGSAPATLSTSSMPPAAADRRGDFGVGSANVSSRGEGTLSANGSAPMVPASQEKKGSDDSGDRASAQGGSQDSGELTEAGGGGEKSASQGAVPQEGDGNNPAFGARGNSEDAVTVGDSRLSVSSASGSRAALQPTGGAKSGADIARQGAQSLGQSSSDRRWSETRELVSTEARRGMSYRVGTLERIRESYKAGKAANQDRSPEARSI